MPTTMMTGEAKKELSKTIRGLREDLLRTLGDALESEYLLSEDAEAVRLDERRRVRRERIEEWIGEQVRGLLTEQQKGARPRFVNEVVKEAAYTWLNRLIVLRLLEANGHTKEQVVTEGWGSGAQGRFRAAANALSMVSETEGYAVLLQLVFDEMALQMPGLFGDVGLVKLVPMPPAMLRRLVEALNDDALESCWTDDTTLGWVYQYWNDPAREGLDKALLDDKKRRVEPHEIAPKTQLFTERYMVEWLLQNSLNSMWLAICTKNGWTPECESNGVLSRLEARREEWRAKREAEEVAREELMPIHGDVEEQWKYWVPQPMPDEVVDRAPASLRDLKLLDPACGSGHFLVAALGLLFAFYREEARHRSERWSDTQIVTWILENNLHGVDIDPRAVQIAAAALMLAARNACGEPVWIGRLNLVAPALRLAALPDGDEAIVDLRRHIHAETGLPETLTNDILGALKGADHLGTLLRIDDAITEALREYLGDGQGDLLTPAPEARLTEDSDAMREAILSHLDAFLSQHATAGDLGLRLRGEQLAAGVRFLELVREGTYDVVVGNPPYLGSSKMRGKKYIEKHYSRGKADLFACFLERGLELAREGGVSAMVTMRNWIFIKQYEDLRKRIMSEFDLRVMGDIGTYAFEQMADHVRANLSVTYVRPPSAVESVAINLAQEDVAGSNHTAKRRAALLVQLGRVEFQTDAFRGIEGWPLVYWWSDAFLSSCYDAPGLSEVADVRNGMSTSNNARYVRCVWEVDEVFAPSIFDPKPDKVQIGKADWAITIMGAIEDSWIDMPAYVLRWSSCGLEMKVNQQDKYGSVSRRIQSQDKYFEAGVAYSTIGSSFSARSHWVRGVFGETGSSIFGDNLGFLLCTVNSSLSKQIARDLNPTVHFSPRDLSRLPVYKSRLTYYLDVYNVLCKVFDSHERTRETSLDFSCPDVSSWSYAQDWAQRAVDQPEGKPLPEWEPEYENPRPEQWVSWSLGVAIGRFDREDGSLDEVPEGTLHAGIMFLSEATNEDSLTHEACGLLHEQWLAHGDAINENSSTKTKEDLRTWLRKRFFDGVHRPMYENAPIYFPLSSSKKSFVAYVSIHRWTSDTLRILQADHLLPERQRIEGQIDDIRATPEEERSRDDQKRLDALLSWLQKLNDFIDMVEQCAERGPPSPDSKTPDREVDAQYDPVLDDGTMINSAALWPLLDPQWKKPKAWWKQLAKGSGRNDYDWSMLASRYFPIRVDGKCQEDPSLAVAHGCFWRYHPERAYAWELRLQDEIEEGFTIDEEGSDVHRQAFLDEHPERAAGLREEELKRRLRKAKKNDEEVDEDELRTQLGLDFGEDNE